MSLHSSSKLPVSNSNLSFIDSYLNSAGSTPIQESALLSNGGGGGGQTLAVPLKSGSLVPNGQYELSSESKLNSDAVEIQISYSERDLMNGEKTESGSNIAASNQTATSRPRDWLSYLQQSRNSSANNSAQNIHLNGSSDNAIITETAKSSNNISSKPLEPEPPRNPPGPKGTFLRSRSATITSALPSNHRQVLQQEQPENVSDTTQHSEKDAPLSRSRRNEKNSTVQQRSSMYEASSRRTNVSAVTGTIEKELFQIKIFEIPNELEKELVETIQYRTALIHAESTVMDCLAWILKKWRYLDEEYRMNSDNHRPLIDNIIKSFITVNRWQLVLFQIPESGSSITSEILDYDIKMKDLRLRISSLGDSVTTELGFRRAPDSKLVPDIFTSVESPFEPCYLLKLDSSYPVDGIKHNDRVPLTHWQPKFLAVSKGRYLLVYRSVHQSPWVQNLLHEIDLSRVRSIKEINLRLIEENPEKEKIWFCIKLSTRTREILFAAVSETKRNTASKQLSSILTQLSDRKSLGKTDSSLITPRDAKALAITLSPMSRLLSKIEESRKLNDIDYPPIDPVIKPVEYLGWSMTTNQSLSINIKELAFSTIAGIKPHSYQQEMSEILSSCKDALNENYFSRTHEKSEKVAGRKNTFLRGWSNSNNQAQSSISNELKSPLFGVSLKDLCTKFDTSGLGIPILPPVIRMSVQFILEKGINVSGIFRVAGNAKRIEQLKKSFEKFELAQSSNVLADGNNGIGSLGSIPAINVTSSISSLDEFDFSSFNVHDVSAVLKMFVRDLPEPLLTTRLYRAFIVTERFKNEPELQLQILRLLVKMLPPPNRLLLFSLLEMMNIIAKHSEDYTDPSTGQIVKGNLMTSSNLAVVMGPNILKTSVVSTTTSSGPDATDKNMSLTTNSQSMAKSIAQKGSTTSLHSADNASNLSAEEEKRSSTNMLSLANQELNDSGALVHVIMIMIEKYQELFTIEPEFLDEIKRLLSGSFK